MKNTYVARAICSVRAENPEYDRGMRGAYLGVLCRALSISDAASLISNEFEALDLNLVGFELIVDHRYLDRSLSEYEKDLLEELDIFPIQYRNVHYFSPDS
ncbi:hypothetical protein GCM10007853_03970 [Algimonas ampicilliniresistens]|uniref:Uncharacterized protein n=1 Tax=Algimonas ampicilliniresistens TaxID=1298735 RepID=A0ABQ5V6P7_9PROT|nr:hypothetical protein GCM10007853_03970 [Algimonas ampicilliniresistens]